MEGGYIMRDYFAKGTDESAPTLFMLHGTGGTEHDLLSVAEMIYPGASVLSVRGNVLENGMPRFFKRLAEGVFDEEDLRVRTIELYNYLNEAAEKYGFQRDNVVAVGYSNGANIAASLLFHYRDVFKGSILFHPMVPLRGMDLPEMNGLPIFIGAGKDDPICPATETEELESLLKGAGAIVDVHWENYGHQLTRMEIEEATNWFYHHYIK